MKYRRTEKKMNLHDLNIQYKYKHKQISFDAKTSQLKDLMVIRIFLFLNSCYYTISNNNHNRYISEFCEKKKQE